MNISKSNKHYIKMMLDTDHKVVPGYILTYAFSWNASPQGREYWNKKQRSFQDELYNDTGRLEYQQRYARAWEKVLTEEDKGFFKFLLRDKRLQRDPFLKAKARPEENFY